MIAAGYALTALVGIFFVVSLATQVLGCLATRRFFQDQAPPPWPVVLPKVSILKPVEGASAITAVAFASLGRLDYPGELEILLGTIRREDPAVALAAQLQAQFPGHNIRLIFAPVRGTNRKTSIMEALRQQADGELLFFSDADVVLPPDYLRHLVPRFTPPDVGCVTCMPRGVPAASLGGRLVALHFNFNSLPQWMLAYRTTGIHWASGATMAVRRPVLEQLGGFTPFLNHLADDYELGNRVSGLGLRVALPPLLLDCATAPESFRDAFRRVLRWQQTIWRARGWQSIGMLFTYPVFWALLLVALHPLRGWAWGVAAAVAFIRSLLALWMQPAVRMPDFSRCIWGVPLVDVVGGLTCVAAFFRRTVVWAGHVYSLQPDGTLVSRSR